MVYKNELDYNVLIDKAMREIVKLALKKAQKITNENFCFLFVINTKDPKVILPKYVKKEYPEEITLILQHQFSNLNVKNNDFSVDLSFGGNLEHITIPFSSLIMFSDKMAGIELSFFTSEEVYLIEQDNITDNDIYSYVVDEEANNNIDINNNIINFNDLKRR